MKKYTGGIEVSQRMCYALMDYYKDLYENFEIKTIPEIAIDLCINGVTVRRILETIYNGKNVDGSFSNMDLMILLCTKFGNKSPYLDDQQDEKIQRLIKRRKIIHELKSSIKNGILEEAKLNKEIETGNKHK